MDAVVDEREERRKVVASSLADLVRLLSKFRLSAFEVTLSTLKIIEACLVCCFWVLKRIRVKRMRRGKWVLCQVAHGLAIGICRQGGGMK